jgi:ethanolamine utilization protein EutN
MTIGTVTGHIHSTISHAFYQAKKLLLVERDDAAGRPSGGYVIAVDTVDAGVGDRVLVLDEGTGARQVIGSPDAPLRSVIVGIVDDVQAD